MHSLLLVVANIVTSTIQVLNNGEQVEGMQYVAADSEEMSIAERIQSLQYATKENINLLKVQMIRWVQTIEFVGI